MICFLLSLVCPFNGAYFLFFPLLYLFPIFKCGNFRHLYDTFCCKFLPISAGLKFSNNFQSKCVFRTWSFVLWALVWQLPESALFRDTFSRTMLNEKFKLMTIFSLFILMFTHISMTLASFTFYEREKFHK